IQSGFLARAPDWFKPCFCDIKPSNGQDRISTPQVDGIAGLPQGVRGIGGGVCNTCSSREGATPVSPEKAESDETSRSEGTTVMRYAIVIEKADGNYSAYVADLPGCVATGSTVVAVEQEIRDAIRFHIDGLKADGLPVPAPTSIAEYVDA